MVSQSTFIPMMTMAVSPEIVALKQIGYDIVDAISVDIFQQGNNSLCLLV